MRQHTEQNKDVVTNQVFIPRTQREVVARDMMDENFKNQVFEKLEYLRREQERDEKLKESLKRLSEPENNSNSHRAAVEKFCKVERSFRAPPEDAEAILDDYYSRVGWKDSPRQSPLRSPGCVLGSRRKSPGMPFIFTAMVFSQTSLIPALVSVSKSPERRGLNRWVSPSYPLPYQAMIQAVPTVSLKSMSAVAVAAAAAPDHSGLNVTLPPTGHSTGKHRGGVPHNTLPSSHRSRIDPTAMQRTAGAGPSKVAKQFFNRCPGTTSDTSGISSGTSSDPSLVNAKLSATSVGINRSSEQWILDERLSAVHLSGDYEENIKLHKQRMAQSSMPSSSSSNNGRAHKSGYHKNMSSSETSHKMFFDKSAGKLHKSVYLPDQLAAMANQRKACSSKSIAAYGGGMSGYPQASFGSNSSSSSTQDHISVGYFLPNESTPYVTKFSGRQITLKQFKQLVPRKGNFRYFFQCASDELGTGMVQREVIDENEVLPLWEGNKIVAKIVCID
ncbi:unnamed protein product [Soboliphyme baturini]|uniref:DIX domain-containing protein n=1 Tax=Soboliphyme baturini TaxID=241478 RepID=A0A183J503_9BILA|nr:unnamed protein product [Soboliphyme baturini]